MEYYRWRIVTHTHTHMLIANTHTHTEYRHTSLELCIKHVLPLHDSSSYLTMSILLFQGKRKTTHVLNCCQNEASIEMYSITISGRAQSMFLMLSPEGQQLWNRIVQYITLSINWHRYWTLWLHLFLCSLNSPQQSVKQPAVRKITRGYFMASHILPSLTLVSNSRADLFQSACRPYVFLVTWW